MDLDPTPMQSIAFNLLSVLDFPLKLNKIQAWVSLKPKLPPIFKNAFLRDWIEVLL